MSKSEGVPSKNRIQIIDALRGVAILLMVLYHFGFNMVQIGVWPGRILFNPALNFLQEFFAGVFIVLCGFSSRYSRNNLKRGIELLLLGLLVSIVSILFKMPIYFGILHFLGLALILYSLTVRAVLKVPMRVAPYLWLSLFAVFYAIMEFINSPEKPWYNPPHLWALGITDSKFFSADYFPVLPWIFIFLFGVWFGSFVRNGNMPGWFYRVRIPFLAAVGRHTLIIYLLHQPVLYLINYLFL